MSEVLKETYTSPCLAIVVPCYNEASVLEKTTEHLLAVLDDMQVLIGPNSRILYVDDGSKDDTWDIIKQDAQDLVKLVEFAKVHIVKPGQSLELK